MVAMLLPARRHLVVVADPAELALGKAGSAVLPALRSLGAMLEKVREDRFTPARRACEGGRAGRASMLTCGQGQGEACFWWVALVGYGFDDKPATWIPASGVSSAVAAWSERVAERPVDSAPDRRGGEDSALWSLFEALPRRDEGANDAAGVHNMMDVVWLADVPSFLDRGRWARYVRPLQFASDHLGAAIRVVIGPDVVLEGHGTPPPGREFVKIFSESLGVSARIIELGWEDLGEGKCKDAKSFLVESARIRIFEPQARWRGCMFLPRISDAGVLEHATCPITIAVTERSERPLRCGDVPQPPPSHHGTTGQTKGLKRPGDTASAHTGPLGAGGLQSYFGHLRVCHYIDPASIPVHLLAGCQHHLEMQHVNGQRGTIKFAAGTAAMASLETWQEKDKRSVEQLSREDASEREARHKRRQAHVDLQAAKGLSGDAGYVLVSRRLVVLTRDVRDGSRVLLSTFRCEKSQLHAINELKSAALDRMLQQLFVAPDSRVPASSHAAACSQTNLHGAAAGSKRPADAGETDTVQKKRPAWATRVPARATHAKVQSGGRRVGGVGGAGELWWGASPICSGADARSNAGASAAAVLKIADVTGDGAGAAAAASSTAHGDKTNALLQRGSAGEHKGASGLQLGGTLVCAVVPPVKCVLERMAEAERACLLHARTGHELRSLEDTTQKELPKAAAKLARPGRKGEKEKPAASLHASASAKAQRKDFAKAFVAKVRAGLAQWGGGGLSDAAAQLSPSARDGGDEGGDVLSRAAVSAARASASESPLFRIEYFRDESFVPAGDVADRHVFYRFFRMPACRSEFERGLDFHSDGDGEREERFEVCPARFGTFGIVDAQVLPSPQKKRHTTKDDVASHAGGRAKLGAEAGRREQGNVSSMRRLLGEEFSSRVGGKGEGSSKASASKRSDGRKLKPGVSSDDDMVRLKKVIKSVLARADIQERFRLQERDEAFRRDAFAKVQKLARAMLEGTRISAIDEGELFLTIEQTACLGLDTLERQRTLAAQPPGADLTAAPATSQAALVQP